MELVTFTGVQFGFASVVPKPSRFAFVVEILSIISLVLFAVFCFLCVCPTAQLYVLQVASLWKGITLRRVGKTPNILSGQPLSPKSSKNNREEGGGEIAAQSGEIHSNSDFFHGLSQLLFGGPVGGKGEVEFVIRIYRFSELGFVSDATDYLLVVFLFRNKYSETTISF
jgi:hypothetical protein